MTYFHTNSRQGAAVLCLRPQNLTQLSVEGAEWCPGPPAAAGVPLHSLLCTEHTRIHRFSVSCMPAFFAWHNKYKAFISTGFQTSADIVIAYMRSIVCWAAQCTSGALSAAVVAANFRDYISSTKMTTLLNSRAVFLSASSLLLLLPALLPSFLPFLSLFSSYRFPFHHLSCLLVRPPSNLTVYVFWGLFPFFLCFPRN